MGIADNAIAEIYGADEAGDVIYQIMKHFNLAGTVFVPNDVRSRIDEYIEDQGPYAEVSDDDREVLVGEYLSYGNWDVIEDRLTQVGNEIITDGVAERMRELGV